MHCSLQTSKTTHQIKTFNNLGQLGPAQPQLVAKLSPKPQTLPPLGAELVLFPACPTTHPPTHPDEFNSAPIEQYHQSKGCHMLSVGPNEPFEPLPSPHWSY